MTDAHRGTRPTAARTLAEPPAFRWVRTMLQAAVLLSMIAPPSMAQANLAPVAGPNKTVFMDEGTNTNFLLDGTDPEMDPLSAVLTAVTPASPQTLFELVDSFGHPVDVGSIVSDRRLFFSPLPNVAGTNFAVIEYRVNDGTQDSANTASVTVNISGVNDAPTTTLSSTLVTDEDTPFNFLMGGFDVEGDPFFSRYIVLADPDFGQLLYHGIGGPFDMSTETGRTQMLSVNSDLALGWPMSFTPGPDECDEQEYNYFTYLFEESPVFQGLASEVTIQVRCVNDGPTFSNPGALPTFATFSALISGSGPYVVGSLFDPSDIDAAGALVTMTVTTGGNGTLTIDDTDHPGVVTTRTPTLLVLNSSLGQDFEFLLAELRYTPDAGPTADTLTFLLNDGGNSGGCSGAATCPLLAGVTIDIAFGGGGDPQAFPLTPGSDGFIIVNTTSDDAVMDGTCSLRDAVSAANSDTAVDGCPAGSGNDIIILSNLSYPLSLGTLDITDPLMIFGVGDAFSSIDGRGAQVFNASSSLNLRDVAILGEDADGDGIRTPVDGVFTGSFTDQSGVASDDFTDEHLGGTTFGTIVTRADLAITVAEVANPSGVAISASGGGVGTAEVDPCNTLVPVQLADGDSVVVTCSSLGITTLPSFTSFTPDSSIALEPVTVDVSVASQGVGGAGVVTGAVTISDGAGASCVGVLMGGSTSCELTPTVAGTRSWTATYSADGVFLGSAQSVSHAVAAAMTTTAITADTPDPSQVGEPVTVNWSLQAVAPAVGTPTGLVTVTDGVDMCSAAVSAGGCSLALTIVGSRTLRASYGDVSFKPSQGTTPHLVEALDFGDAPVTYPVLLADDGPRHALGSLFLGSTIDADIDGQPSPDALGDDTSGADDEDGISFAGPLATGGSVDLTIVASGPGLVDLWIDFDGDGTYGVGVGDRVLFGFPVVAGSNIVSIAVPSDAVLGTTFARVRLSTLGVFFPLGFAADGEVEDHAVTVVDGAGPKVQALASLAGSSIDDCATIGATNGFGVTFDEPVQMADQIASYRVLAAGPDADFSTSSCGAPAGDDIARSIATVSSDLDPATPTFTVDLDNPLPTGLVRLIVCEAVEDLAGNPIDGNGDGTGGDPFVTTFRVDPINLFTNGDFDRCPVTVTPWLETVTAPNAIKPSESEDADSSTLSGSVEINSLNTDSIALAQCVAFPSPLSRLDLAVRARFDAIGAATATLDVACDFFDLAACAGPIIAGDTATTPLPDLAGGWNSFLFSLEPLPTTVSALCSIAVTADDPDEPDFDAYLDRLSLTPAAMTTTTITADTPDPSRVGESVAVSWTVDVVAPGVGTPTGLVTVSDGTDMCSAAVDAGGCSLALTTVGARTLTASYAGDGSFGASQGTAGHMVDPANTTTTITADTPDPSSAFQPIQVEVTVSALAPGAGTPTGDVSVDDGAGASCTATLGAGIGSCMLTPTIAGTRNLGATYAGTADFVTSSTTESHQVDGTDFGDAPAPYPVLLADDGARHAVGSLFLGSAIDAEHDGQPSADALGDDTGGADDEDGISFGGPFVTGGFVDLTVIASEPGVLDAWIDFAGDGSWLEAGDRVLTAFPLVAGSNTLSIAVPDDAALGATVGRFRLSSLGVADPIGLAADGEVEDHTVTVADGIAPKVLALTSLVGSAIDDCATVRAAPTSLRVTFDEAVQNADQVGSYLVLAAGPDADFSTTSCAGPVGDDIARTIASTSSDLDPSTPTLTLQLDGRLPTGLVRLFVCETVEDLAANPLDGDGDGVGGDPFVITFRVDSDNLFTNGDFDRCPVTVAPWLEIATPPDAILPSESEDADSSTLSGSAQLFSATSDSTAIAQCVAVQSPVPRLDLALEARLDALGTATATLTVDCDFFDLAGCAGQVSAGGVATTPLPDLAGAWTRFVFSFKTSPTAVSALCSVAVTPDDPGEPNFDAYVDQLFLVQTLLFSDGFESGDTSAWSLAVGD